MARNYGAEGVKEPENKRARKPGIVRKKGF
jgi:ATP-dependent Lhr-like helicase